MHIRPPFSLFSPLENLCAYEMTFSGLCNAWKMMLQKFNKFTHLEHGVATFTLLVGYTKHKKCIIEYNFIIWRIFTPTN